MVAKRDKATRKGSILGGSKRGRKPPPPGETKRGKFLRVGASRMNNALYYVELIGNLSHPDYQWTDEDVAKMRQALLDKIDETFKRFAPKVADRRPGINFTFGD